MIGKEINQNIKFIWRPLAHLWGVKLVLRTASPQLKSKFVRKKGYLFEKKDISSKIRIFVRKITYTDYQGTTGHRIRPAS